LLVIAQLAAQLFVLTKMEKALCFLIAHLILLLPCYLAFQQLDIDYVIGESHKELLPKSSGPAAIIRIFGVTREGIIFLFSNKFSLQCGFC
jgi:hypothetical protein